MPFQFLRKKNDLTILLIDHISGKGCWNFKLLCQRDQEIWTESRQTIVFIHCVMRLACKSCGDQRIYFADHLTMSHYLAEVLTCYTNGYRPQIYILYLITSLKYGMDRNCQVNYCKNKICGKQYALIASIHGQLQISMTILVMLLHKKTCFVQM
jgi:hypothetical protein